MPSLPTVRRSGANMTFVPDSDAFTKCLEVAANDPEVLYYLRDRAQEIFSSSKSMSETVINSVMGTINDYINYVELAHASRGDEWVGKIPTSPFQNYQEGLAAIASKIMSGKKVEFDYDMGDDSQFLRRYISEDNPLDEHSEEAMDKSFNAWLAANHLYSKSGIIYESTPDGHIKMEGDNAVKVNADDFRKLIKDPKKGFEQYMSRTNKSMQVTMYDQQEYQPSETPTPKNETTAASRSKGG